ncbi:M23 family metallopeptidase [Pseudomonadota bacterium]
MQTRLRCLLAAIGVAINISCTPESWQYGNIIDHGEDPYNQNLVLEIPENAPSIERRFRLLDDVPWSNLEDGDAAHLGIDLSGQVGVPILAVADGRIKKSQYHWWWGNYIEIDHGKDQSGFYLQSTYAHMSGRYANTGDRISRGQHIGDLGNSGQGALTPHLHFVVYRGSNETLSSEWRAINPHLLWVDGIGKITCFDSDRPYADLPLRFTYPGKCK